MAGFRPTLIPTLVTLPALVVLFGLGTWQLQRLAWKEALIAERQAALAAPPIPLPEFDAKSVEALSFRRVSLSGHYLADKRLVYGSRVIGERGGSDLLTAFRLDDGRTVMVNRGWLPSEAFTTPVPSDAGDEVSGVLRPARREGNWFTPAPDLAKGHWFLYDTEAMGRHLGLELLPAVVEALPGADPDALPRAHVPTVEIRNAHLQYALTWYALALVLVAIYVIYHLRRPD